MQLEEGYLFEKAMKNMKIFFFKNHPTLVQRCQTQGFLLELKSFFTSLENFKNVSMSCLFSTISTHFSNNVEKYDENESFYHTNCDNSNNFCPYSTWAPPSPHNFFCNFGKHENLLPTIFFKIKCNLCAHFLKQQSKSLKIGNYFKFFAKLRMEI